MISKLEEMRFSFLLLTLMKTSCGQTKYRT